MYPCPELVPLSLDSTVLVEISLICQPLYLFFKGVSPPTPFISLVVLKFYLITYSENTILRPFPEGAELFTQLCPVWARACICTFTHQGLRAEPPGPSPVPTHLTNCTSEVGGPLPTAPAPGNFWATQAWQEVMRCGTIWIHPLYLSKESVGRNRTKMTFWVFLHFSSENWVRFWGLEIWMRAILVFTSLQSPWIWLT